ncbi:OLC1v1033817C1 [Oldenlandia corymbosa var. corymbosa]|uniref:OLC1v1033817C1 n=1 Tax=Oldenlandia corymbosa var. corymbosa TaxID=529605 RepID=A0AAV1CPV2_OLDCO|nr:OLC1v1033817C1 [Oldenlandia corymbosa var. corymbosa]
MAKNSVRFCLVFVLFLAVWSLKVLAGTDDLDVQALRSVYNGLNRPPQLKGWTSEGGDPCGESWTGVSCNGSSVNFIQLPGLELTGNIGIDLFNLKNLKQLDLSSNKIQGEIPLGLPINVTDLNLSSNNLSQNIPYSLIYMKNLRHLNLSHNELSGILGDFFTGLENLIEMDLSHNNITGDLPSSFASLTNLSKLYLQGNAFTGSVLYLAKLPLTDLNIEDNNFSGVIPEEFQQIKNLRFGGNKFHRGDNYPEWKYPLDTLPYEENISSPPNAASNAIETYPTKKFKGQKKRRMGGTTAFLVGGGTLLAAFAGIAAAVIHIRRSQTLKGECRQSSLMSLATSSSRECSSTAAECSPHLSLINSPPGYKSWRLHSVQTKPFKVARRSFSTRNMVPISVKLFSAAELQLATNNFSPDHLLGHGSLGSVYRAESSDGEMMAVKSIEMVELSLNEEERFLNVVRQVAKLRHPNVVTLLGYCTEHGSHHLVYEYVRNFSLDEALHDSGSTPLAWGLRLRIALGIARGINYLHSSCMPPVAHSNLKASNILLDEDMRPRISDGGLAILRSLSSNSVKLKASEMAISDRGYIAPENVPSGDNLKGDVYAFGVLLLELLTGRLPFDSSKPTGEQFLARWASKRLHDSDYLEQMVDPAIKLTIPSQGLSHFADIVSLCIQPEREFRPAMSEVVESLLLLLQKQASTTSRSLAGESSEVDPFNQSNRSYDSRFCGSPSLSYYSI